MFYLVNLTSGSELTFESKRAVLSYWRWKIQGEFGHPELVSRISFNELNITGKDTFYGCTPVPILYGELPVYHYAYKWVKKYDYVYEWRLKKYQVLDERRRSCDIREWTSEIEEVLRENSPSWQTPRRVPHNPRFRVDPVACGSKCSNASRRLPAFTRQRLEIYLNESTLDVDDDLLGFTPTIDHSRPRKLDRIHKKYKDSDRKCWKRASKNKSQWARHMDRAPEYSMKEELTWSQEEEANMILLGEPNLLEEY